MNNKNQTKKYRYVSGIFYGENRDQITKILIGNNE